MATFRYALCIALATALCPLMASQNSGMPKQLSYSTPFSSDQEEEDMFELLKTDLSVYTDKKLVQRSVCSLSIEDFKALAQKMASRIVCEKVEEAREKAGNDHDVIIRAGVKALSDHEKYSLENTKLRRQERIYVIQIAGETTYERSQEERKIDEIKFVVAKMQADIELNVAQQLLPLSFHWNILRISHKAGFAAITALAVVGVYKLGSMLFGPSKQLAYDASLVAAANNQNDQ